MEKNYHLPITEVDKKLTEVGLLIDGKLVSFAQFKKLADTHSYTGWNGHRIKKYIIFVGNPRNNLFGFYPPATTKKESLEIAYSYLMDVDQNYIDENIVWGNWGIPISYGKLRAIEPVVNEPISILEDELR